jgi:hypothetical protein
MASDNKKQIWQFFNLVLNRKPPQDFFPEAVSQKME